MQADRCKQVMLRKNHQSVPAQLIMVRNNSEIETDKTGIAYSDGQRIIVIFRDFCIVSDLVSGRNFIL